ncbi:MAG: heavy-metal-associated domain-containing protein [Bacteroidales bacterium]
MKELKLKIPNMKCMGCAKTIEDHLEKVGGVDDISTDIPDKTVTIMYNGDNTIKKLIMNTLAGIGYPAVEV